MGVGRRPVWSLDLDDHIRSGFFLGVGVLGFLTVVAQPQGDGLTDGSVLAQLQLLAILEGEAVADSRSHAIQGQQTGGGGRGTHQAQVHFQFVRAEGA